MLYQENFQDEENPSINKLSCFIYKRAKKVGYEKHCHTHLEFYYLIDGEFDIELGGKIQTIKSGDMMFVPSLEMHSMSFLDNTASNVMILQVSTNFLGHGIQSTGKSFSIQRGSKISNSITYHIEENSNVGKTVTRLIDLSRSHVYLSDSEGNSDTSIAPDNISEYWQLKGLTYTLFSELLNEDIIKICDSEYDRSDSSALKRFHTVLKFMYERPEEKLTMEDAAQITCMSYHHFSHTFKECFGYSFVEYQNIKRIRRAEELLQSPDKSITEISQRLHFGTISYFNRIFKKYNGDTPSNYRNGVNNKKGQIYSKF